MGQSNKRVFYSVNSVTPYDNVTGKPYGQLKVLGEASVQMTGDLQELNGGASKFPWAVEEGNIKSDISLKIKEYPAFLWQLFQGQAPTVVSADAAGTVSALTNKLGTSIVGATGIASIGITPTTGKNDLKFTKFVVVAVSATTVDVYGLSDINFGRGTSASFQDDALKINLTPLTITQSIVTVIPGLGLGLTGGSGTIAMTVGDTATFMVQPPSTDSMTVKVGSAQAVYPEFGLLIYGKQLGNKQMVEIDIYRAKAIGLPLAFTENKFSESDIKIKAFYDVGNDAVYSLRHISPSS